MARALSFTCAVLLICLGGSAWANKPRLAVLGLEVLPGPSGVVDPVMTQLARDITRDLRQRAQSGASRYTLAPNSNKELTDEKLLMSCDNEAVTCMVMIGAGLAADVMLYGHLERKGESYRVSVKLLDVKAKTVELGSEDMPVGGAPASVSKKLYNRLIGDVALANAGTLVVKARTQGGGQILDGRVMVDEQVRGTLAGGTLTVQGLPEGPHVVAIETEGRYQRFEDRVTVRAGDLAIVDALLIDRAAGSSPRRSALWKVSLGAGIVIAAAGGAFAYYSYDQMMKSEDNIFPVTATGNMSATSDDCGEDVVMLKLLNPDLNTEAFQSACSWQSRIYLGYAVGAVGAVGAIVSLIMVSRDPPVSEHPASRTRGKKSSVAIVPVAPNGGAGASLSLRW
jgi:hypothetical protein